MERAVQILVGYPTKRGAAGGIAERIAVTAPPAEAALAREGAHR